MRTVLIWLSVAISIAFATVERKSAFTKPIINLEKRPRPPVWNRPPEERRRLSIFPKTNLKFVVTPKPVQTDNTAKEASTTKRPIMRKFVMQDKNDKGTWSFAPREPLMKTKRFTVTLAPPKFTKEIDEPKVDESKKISTVIRNLNVDHQPRKVFNLKKGNFSEMTQHNKVNNTVSKTLKNVEHEHVGEVNSDLLITNDAKDLHLIQMKENKTMNMRNESSEGLEIDVRRLNNDDAALRENVNLKNEGDFKDAESRTIDLSELTYPIDQNVHNSLIINNINNDNRKAGQVLAFNDLQMLLEKIVNQTEDFNMKSVTVHNDSDTTSITNSQTNDTLEDVSQFDVTEPNTFYEVMSVDNAEDENKNLKAESTVAKSIVQDSIILGNVDKTAVSDTNELNEAKLLAETTVHSLVVGNLENLLNYMEQEKNNLTTGQGKTFNDDKKETEKAIVDELTTKSNANSPDADEITSIFTGDVTKDELQTEQPGKSDNNNSTNLSSAEILLEVYESDRDLSSEESSAESLNGKDSSEISKESVTDSSILASENIFNEARENSDESINNHTEEHSNEPLIDASNNLTDEVISNESSSNKAAEELSNEYDVDKSNNLTEEVLNESMIETSNSFTDEERSDISSLNISSQVSNESNADKSISLTEEASNELIMENFSNFTGEEISNESSSNMAGEELSDESYINKSNNLTDEVSNQSGVGTSNSFTGEDESDEWLEAQPEGVVEELISDESAISSQDPSVEEISVEGLTNRFKRSNNIIEEENMATTISGFKYTGHVKSLNHDLSYKNINA